MNKILRGMILITATLIMAACATPQVHLFSTGMASDDVDRVRSHLERAGYTITLNTLPVPDAIVGPTLGSLYMTLMRLCVT